MAGLKQGFERVERPAAGGRGCKSSTTMRCASLRSIATGEPLMPGTGAETVNRCVLPSQVPPMD